MAFETVVCIHKEKLLDLLYESSWLCMQITHEFYVAAWVAVRCEGACFRKPIVTDSLVPCMQVCDMRLDVLVILRSCGLNA